MRNRTVTKVARLLRAMLFTLCCALSANGYAEENAGSGEAVWSKVTEMAMSMGELTDSSQIMIYPYNQDAVAGMALSGNLTDQVLTSTEKAEGGGIFGRFLTPATATSI